MHQVQLDDAIYQEAERQAAEAGFSSVDQYIAELLIGKQRRENEDLEHLFAPEVIANLDQIAAEITAGGQVYSMDKVQEYFAKRRKEWLRNHAE